MKIYACLAVGNLLVGLLTGGSPGGAVDIVGSLSLVEAAVLFLLGASIDFSHSVGFHKLRQLLEPKLREWSLKESEEAERRSLAYILPAVALTVETLILAAIR